MPGLGLLSLASRVQPQPFKATVLDAAPRHPPRLAVVVGIGHDNLADDYCVPDGSGVLSLAGDFADRESNKRNEEIRVPVFVLGEILVLHHGVEVGGRCRNPSKWKVELEFFDTIEEAVRRSLALSL